MGSPTELEVLFRNGKKGDWQLRALAQIAEQAQEEGARSGIFVVTLFVGGRLITGRICGYQQWLHSVDAAWGDGSPAGLVFGKRALPTASVKGFEFAVSLEDEAFLNQEFIHLVEASVDGTSVVDVPWRGKFTSIDGWTPATMAADDDLDQVAE